MTPGEWNLSEYAEQKAEKRQEALKALVAAYAEIGRKKQVYTDALWTCRDLGISHQSMGNTLGLSEAAVRSWMRRNGR